MAIISREVREEISSTQIISDHYLAWQLQAEEYKKAYQSSSGLLSSSLSTETTPPILQFHPAQDQSISFNLKPTSAEDRDCFFHAVNKSGFTRETLIKELLANASNEEIRTIFAHEIRQFLYLGYAGPHADSQENEICQQLLTKKIKDLFSDLNKEEQSFREEIMEARSALGESVTQDKNVEELLKLLLLEERNSFLATTFKRAYKKLLKTDNVIYQYCSQEDVFRQYVEQYLGRARGYISFARDFGSERPTTTIDVINQLFQLTIQVYLPNEPNGTQLILANKPQPEGAIPIFHNGINHFWGLTVLSSNIRQSTLSQLETSQPIPEENPSYKVRHGNFDGHIILTNEGKKLVPMDASYARAGGSLIMGQGGSASELLDAVSRLPMPGQKVESHANPIATPGYQIELSAEGAIANSITRGILANRPVLKPTNPWNLPSPDLTSFFTGRDREFAVIHKAFTSSHVSSIRQYITGKNGMGKTSLAVEYAHRSLRGNTYDFIIFIRANNQTILYEDFKSLGLAFGILPTEINKIPVQNLINFVYKWLADYQRVLLIFDDAKSLNAIRCLEQPVREKQTNFEPPLLAGTTIHWLITTDNLCFSNQMQRIILDKFTPEEASTYIKTRLPEASDQQADTLAKAVDYMPSNLAKASEYVFTAIS